MHPLATLGYDFVGACQTASLSDCINHEIDLLLIEQSQIPITDEVD
jgi:hypothetical protein